MANYSDDDDDVIGTDEFLKFRKDLLKYSSSDSDDLENIQYDGSPPYKDVNMMDPSVFAEEVNCNSSHSQWLAEKTL